jgi:heat shock protein HslJ
MRRAWAAAALAAFPLGIGPGIGAEAEFPFEHELLLDVAPMPGSRRVPSLEVQENGRAELDLWCAIGPARVTLTGEAISIVPGALTMRACSDERMRRDEELLSALSQARIWRREDDVIVLVGPQTLRFLMSTH